MLVLPEFAKFQLFKSSDMELHYRAWNTLSGTALAIDRDERHAKQNPSYAKYTYRALGFDAVRCLGVVELLSMPLQDVLDLRKIHYKARRQTLRVMALQAEIKKIQETHKLLPKLMAELKGEEAALAAMPK